jgi:hypothetical protein
MPNRKGPDTYKGYKSPNTSGWPKPIRQEVKKVYGAFREKHPGESHATKSKGSRIAWSIARRKYPRLYAQHTRREKGIEQEMKEHPWANKKTAARIVMDHERTSKKLKSSGHLQKARENYISNPDFESGLKKTYSP